MANDITKTGPVGLRGLPGLNKSKNPLDTYLPNSKNINASLNPWTSDSVRPVGVELGELGYGNSKYDKDITNMSQARNIDEFRAQEQPWYDQIANGAIKMVSTAATTFIDGTLGALIGLGTGIYNMVDDDPSTGFWRGMWDNAITSAMSDIQEGMEETFKNYRSEWEQNASVFERMFSANGAANFWGDDILKNAGFTIGAAASIAATGGVGNALKGVGWLGKAAKGLRLAKMGSEGLEATKAGKLASWIGKTFVSTQGEAAIEAFNATKDNRKVMENNLSSRIKERTDDAEIERAYNISQGMSVEEAQTIYNKRIIDINADAAATRSQWEKELQDAGNTIYAANIAALSISNNLTLGSMIRGGYGNAKSLLEQAVKTSAGKPITTVKEAGEALLRGELKFDAPAVKGALPKALGHWALESTQEGLEEGVQNLASTSGQMVVQGRMNNWVKDNTMLGTMINPDAEEDLTSYGKAIMKAYQDQFGALNSQGWTEVMAGFISGALGVPGMHRNAEGKLRPTWNGGLRESWETVNGNRNAVQKQAELMNKALTDNKFNDRVKHAVQQIAIKRGQDEALAAGNIMAFKNLEIQQLLSDAVFFRDIGMLDDYLAMYKSLAEGVTDQDITEFKAAVKSEKGDTSALEKMSDDELKSLYQEKAKRTLDKLEEALASYKSIEDNYGGKFSDATRKEAMMEMSYLNALYWDTQRRAGQIRDKIDELKRKENRTPLEEEELGRYIKAEQQLSKQAISLRDNLNEYKNSPKKLQSNIENRQLERQKINLYKKADEAIKKYKEANTLQDVIDVYSYSPEEDREAVLTQAIDQAEGETKALLQQFKNYMGDVNTLEQVIDSHFPSTVESPNRTNMMFRQAFRGILNDIVNEMVSDESPVLSRETLKEKLKAKLEEFNTDFENATANAQGVKVNEDGNYDFTEALNSGAVSEDDFEDVLDNADTGESHREIKEGSDAEAMAQSASDAKGLQDLMDHLNFFIDSLDKLDELRKAGEAKKKKAADSKTESKKGKKTSYKKKDIEDGEEESGIWGEEEEPEPTPVELLSEKEKKAYHVVDKEGSFGITYHTIQKDSEDRKAKESISKKFNKTDLALSTQEDNFARAKTPEDKQAIIEKMLDIIANNVISGKTLKRIDAFLVRNSSYLKPEDSKKDSGEEHDNSKGQATGDDTTSLNGNQHPRFKSAELSSSSKKLVVYNGPTQDWMAANGFQTQKIIDQYLGKIITRDASKKVQDRTPVHYIHNNKEQSNIIFLGIEYSKVKDVIPKDVSNTIKGQDGKEYLIIGTLGWEADRQGTHEMFDSIMDECSNGEHTSEGWSINTEHTNRLKDITAGAMVKQAIGDNESKPRDLRELLAPNRNPLNIQLEDIGWTVVEGSDEKLTYKYINVEASKSYKLNGGRPGQVYMHIPTANGRTIPVYMETMFYQELEDGTPLDEEIKKLIQILADKESTTQDKTSAIARLKGDLLIFSKANQLHFNDEKSKYDPNTIYITKDGEPIKIIDFNNDTGTFEDLVAAIKSVNPRINISTTELSRDPSIYLNSGVLKTDVALLGTVNSKFFLFPVDKDNNFIENKIPKPNSEIYSGSVKERVYLNGSYVYFDGNKFTNEKGETIQDRDGSLRAAYDIKQGKYKPLKLNDGKYYEVNGVMYVDNGHGGLSIVDKELRDKVLKSGKKINKAVGKKEKVKKEAKKIEDRQEPQVEEGEEEGDWDELNQEKEKKPKAQKPKAPAQLQGQQPQQPTQSISNKNQNEPSSVEERIIITSSAERNGEEKGDHTAFGKEGSDLWRKQIDARNITRATDRDKYKIADGVYLVERPNGVTTIAIGPTGPRGGAYGIHIWRKLTDEEKTKISELLRDMYKNAPPVYNSYGESDKMLAQYIDNIMHDTVSNQPQHPSTPQAEEKEKKNFTNSTNIDDMKSQEEIDKQLNASGLAAALSKRANKEKRKQLYQLVKDKFGITVDNNLQLMRVLSEKEIDISSDDLDTVIDIVENCRT